MVTEQRIEFNIHRLNEVTGGYLLDDMNRVQKRELLELVLEHLSDILENGEDGDTEDDTFAYVKAYPPANDDDIAVLEVYEGPYLAQTHVDDLLSFCTINALGAYEDDFHADDDREDNPSHSGLPLGSLALGAVLGAAAIHFMHKRPQP